MNIRDCYFYFNFVPYEEEYKWSRDYYNMSASWNVYSYISKEGKRTLEDSAKRLNKENTGVFNLNGIIESKELEDIKLRAKNNRGNIWYGYITICMRYSFKIDMMEKCIPLLNNIFLYLTDEEDFRINNIDLICALHMDTPSHFHMHYVFFEKQPLHIKENGEEGIYREKGRIEKSTLYGLNDVVKKYIYEDTKDTYILMLESCRDLNKLILLKNINVSREDIFNEVISLKKVLPRIKNLRYESEEMKPFRKRVDNILRMLFSVNKDAKNANDRFYKNIENKRREDIKVERQTLMYSIKGGDAKKLDALNKLKEEYKCRQGNLVINLAKAIDEEYYEESEISKQSSVNRYVRARVKTSKAKINSLFSQFILSFGEKSHILERDFSNRLSEVEKEKEYERERKEKEEVNERIN